MKKLLLILLCLPMIGFGQGWIKTYGIFDEGGGIAVKQTVDGGYIVFGDKIIKTDSSGDTLWTRNFSAEDGLQTNDGGYILCGFDGGDSFMRLDSQGDTIWTKPYSGNSIVKATGGGFVFINNNCSGNPYKNNINNIKNDKDCSQINLFKTDTLGNLLWSKTFFEETIYGSTSASNLVRTSDGGYMIFGYPLIKTDVNGDTLWTKGYNNGRINYGNKTLDGGYIMTGEYDTIQNGIQLANAIFLLKTDSSGNQIFTKTYPPPLNYNEIWSNNVITTQDGGYLISAIAGGNANEYYLYIIKTNNLGDTLWTNTFGGPFGFNILRGDNIQQTTDGGYILSGVFWDGINPNPGIGGGVLTVLIKMNHLGTLTSITESPLKNDKGKLLKVTDLLGRETKGKTNQPLFYIYDDGTVEKRIVIE